MPVAGAVVLWQVTGSAYALWFAALGPLMAGASVWDARRAARRARRRAQREHESSLTAVRSEIARRHETERRELWERHPDVAAHVRLGTQTWRRVPGRDETLVVGRGTAVSAMRVDGPADDRDVRAVQQDARRIRDVPVTVPLTAGVAVVGPETLAASVQRALAVQLLLTHPPGELRLATVPDDAAAADWARDAPHGRATTGLTVALCEGDQPVPGDVDIPLVRVAAAAPPPPRCAAVLTLIGSDRARLDHDGLSQEVSVEAVSVEQARAVVAELAARARALGQADASVADWQSLMDAGPVPAAGSLPAAVGTSGRSPFVLDLVADGPHAVVIGVTGSGKSELLTTWVAALATTHSPQEVVFLLVDFKGGRTFDALTPLPHVTGVLTDLDEAAALRAVQSLRAEIRHRERVLADAGARDVSEADGLLPRLVIVVDEYAALVSAHPELHVLFADIAARGRALGLHLILASQRAAGVFRDAVLANAPLRIALRVTDAADSRAVLGGDEAVRLSGRVEDRGSALVRRAADAAPVAVRVVQCDAPRIAAIARRWPPTDVRRPWLPVLPARVPLAALLADRTDSDGDGDGIVLGLADEPELQQQRTVRLAATDPGLVVVGSSGSGRSTVLRAVAAQAARSIIVPAEPEEAWDAVATLETATAGTAVLIDDLDLLLTRLPAEHGAALRERLEACARTARGRGVQLVVSMQRIAGPAARVAELLPRRALLAQPSRADHVAAGGEGADFLPDQPPGRGRLDGALVQFADPDGCESGAPPADAERGAETHWRPGTAPVAYVAAPGPRTRAVLTAWERAGIRTAPLERVVARSPSASSTAAAHATVIWAAPEEWLAQWKMLAAARAEAQLVIDVACAAEFRSLTASRELPPFALPGRAWLRTPEGAVRRVVLPT